MVEQVDRFELARQKTVMARELFQQGETPDVVREKIKQRYGKGLGGTTLYQIHRDVTGKSRRFKRRRKRVQKTAKTTGKPAQKLVPFEIPASLIPPQPVTAPTPAVDSLLRMLVQAMRSEGVDSLVIRADGGGRIYHITEREINITGG